MKIWYSRGSTSRSPLGQSFATSRQEYENHLPPAFCIGRSDFSKLPSLFRGFTRDIKKKKKETSHESRLETRFHSSSRDANENGRCYEASRDRSRDRTSFPNFVKNLNSSLPSSCGYFPSSKLEFATDINYSYFLSTFSRVISNLYLRCVKLLEFIDSEINFFFSKRNLSLQQPSLEITLSIETSSWSVVPSKDDYEKQTAVQVVKRLSIDTRHLRTFERITVKETWNASKTKENENFRNSPTVAVLSSNLVLQVETRS